MSGFVIPDETRRSQSTAADPAVSAWVAAHAGSGKTHVLAQRVIRLLLEGTDPARILCLTYTRAAAANMATRVFDTLGAWTRLDDVELARNIAELRGAAPSAAVLARARRLFAEALETPGGLKIQTIHAFCEAVLHQFPLEANIAGHFEMMDARMEAALVAEARREMIAGTTDPDQPGLAEAFAMVLDHGGEFGLEGLLSEVVSRRDSLRRFLDRAGTGAELRCWLHENLEVPEDASPASILATFWPDPYFTRTRCEEVADRANTAAKVRASEFADSMLAIFALDDPRSILIALRDVFLRRSNSQWQPKSARNIAPKDVAAHFPELTDEFDRMAGMVLEATDRLALLGMLEATHAALTVADRLIAIYERLKSARGYLDFNDLIVRTVNLLARQDASAWVQYKLDKGIDHILIDEAQDTSPDQWAVVNALAADFFAGRGAREEARRTIFAVGDEKQSIYSFQGADPESFWMLGRNYQKTVADAGSAFEHVRLRHSFRSVEDVLAAVDLTFSREEVRQGLTRDPEPLAHRAIRQAAPGYVELWPSLAPQIVDEPDDWTQPIDHASAPAVRLAATIADTIKHWLDGKDRIEGRGRRLEAGDILVLVRKRDSFVHALSRELKNRDIAVAGADRLALTDHIAVQDLMAAGRVVLQPDDDLSLAALLKSPIFGLSEEQLYDLAAVRPAGMSLFSRLLEDAGATPELAEAAKALARWRREAGYSSPFTFYARLLGRDGVRAAMIARLGSEAGDVVDEFLNFCLSVESVGVRGLEALLGLLETGGPEIKREMDQARGEVRIMTAHSAKGLEAPVVFLVDGGSSPFSHSHLPALLPFEARFGDVAGEGYLWRTGNDTANTTSQAICEAIGRKAEEEYRRLLYVAMTRAEDRLIVCGYQGKRAPSDMTWHSIVCAALMDSPDCREVEHATTGETIHRYRVSAAMPVSEAEPVEPARPAAPMPDALLRLLAPAPIPPRPLVPSGATAAVEPDFLPAAVPGSPVLDAERPDSIALRRGVAVHRLLQKLPHIPAAGRRETALAYLARFGGDWKEDERQALWEEVEAILSDDRFSPIFAEDSRAEVSIMGRLAIAGAERSIAGKIDRLAVGPDRVLIVDYKTNRPAPRSVAEVPDSHIAQIALYRELLRPLYPEREIAAALLYTQSPILIEPEAAVMEAALAALARA